MKNVEKYALQATLVPVLNQIKKYRAISTSKKWRKEEKIEKLDGHKIKIII